MKLVTFAVSDGSKHIGALMNEEGTIAMLASGEKVMDGRVSSFYSDMLAFLDGGLAARERAQSVLEFISRKHPPATTIPLQDVKLLAPVLIPASMRDCMSFEQHIINSIRVVGFKRLGFLDEWVEKVLGRKRSLAYLLNRPWYDRPIYYKGNRRSVIGTNSDVKIPPYTQKFDYELEFGIYICKQGVNIPREKARDYIGGYTIFNDFSARDIQLKEQGEGSARLKAKTSTPAMLWVLILLLPMKSPIPIN